MVTFPLVRGACDPDTGTSPSEVSGGESLAAERGLGQDTKETSPLEVPCLSAASPAPTCPPPARCGLLWHGSGGLRAKP